MQTLYDNSKKKIEYCTTMARELSEKNINYLKERPCNSYKEDNSVSLWKFHIGLEHDHHLSLKDL